VLENQLFAPTLKGVIDFIRTPVGRQAGFRARGKRRNTIKEYYNDSLSVICKTRYLAQQLKITQNQIKDTDERIR
jgi:hypothetical protein